MGLDVYLRKLELTTIHSSYVTHNLNKMADEAGIYNHLWRPDEIGISKAQELIAPLMLALEKLRDEPDFFKKFEPINGYGTYEYFVKFVDEYLKACIENQDANVMVSR